MAIMTIYKKQIEEIEQLHKAYLDLRENTPEFQRDGEECKAYHAWYDTAYVFFSSVEVLRESKDYSIFKEAQKDGNCFVLEHIYNNISASYKVLMKQAAEIESVAASEQELNMLPTWPFETNDDHRRVFISYSWDNDVHMAWVLRLCQNLRAKGVDAILDQAMRKGKDLIDFMDKGIEHAHRVLIIGTPNYKRKSEEEKGSVKYEQNIIKASLLHGIGSDRYIPILREGDFPNSFPAIISTKGGYDLRNDADYQEHLTSLVHEIYDKPILELNPIGAIPDFAQPETMEDKPVHVNENDSYITLVKRYLSSPEYNISFSDLITKMANEAFQKIMEKASYDIPLNRNVFAFYTDWHHEAVKDLMDAAILTAQWGSAQQVEQFGQVLCKLSMKPLVNGEVTRAGSELLHGIGAQLLFNVIGMACVKYEKFGALEKILSLKIPAPHFKNINYRQSLIQVLGEQYWNNNAINQMLGQNYHFPWSIWIKDISIPHFKPYIIAESDIESLYYTWEQLKSLVFGYKWGNKMGQHYFTTGFFLHYRVGLLRNIDKEDPYSIFYAEADKLKDEWPPLKQGMFGGEYLQYKDIIANAEEFYKSVMRW